MFWSWWNKKLNYQKEINKSSNEVFNHLSKYYNKNINNKYLQCYSEEMQIMYRRGNIVASVFCIGSELWLKHFVTITLKEISKDLTKVDWEIDLKFLGLQLGKNAILEDCKKACNELV